MLSRGPAPGPRIAAPAGRDRAPVSARQASRTALRGAPRRWALDGPGARTAAGAAEGPLLRTAASDARFAAPDRPLCSGLGATRPPRPPPPCRASPSRAGGASDAPRPAWQDFAWEDEPRLALPAPPPVDQCTAREAKKEERKRTKEERRRKRMERGRKKDAGLAPAAARPAPDASALLARRGRAAIDWDDDDAWERDLVRAAGTGAGRGGDGATTGGGEDGTEEEAEETETDEEEAEKDPVEGHLGDEDEGEASSDAGSSPSSSAGSALRVPPALRGVLPPTADGSLPPHNEELAALLPPRCKLVVTDWRRKLVGIYSLRETLRIAAWRQTDVFLAVWKHAPAKGEGAIDAAARGGRQTRADDSPAASSSSSLRASSAEEHRPVVRLVRRSLVQALWRLSRASAQRAPGAASSAAHASAPAPSRRALDPQRAPPKSIRIGAHVDERDLQLKLKSVRRLLDERHRVRIQIVGVRRPPPRRPGKGGRESYAQREARLAEAARARLALADRLIGELQSEASISGRPKTTGVSVTLEVSPKGGKKKT